MNGINTKLRLELLEQRREWNKRVPPHITKDVALTVFERFLTSYPDATPEVIAIELIDRVDSWEEVAAVRAALRKALRSSTAERLTADQPMNGTNADPTREAVRDAIGSTDMTDQQQPDKPIIIPRGGLQQWLAEQTRGNRDRYHADWLAKAVHAANLAEDEPWPAWSTGEVLAVALILGRGDMLDAEGYTEDEALERLRHDIGASPDEVRTFFTGLRELV